MKMAATKAETKSVKRREQMKTMVEEVQEMRDQAIKASEGDEAAAPYLCPMFGSLTQDMCKGLTIGLKVAVGVMLSKNLK